MIRYIVTGGAGLIGSNVVRELNQNGISDILLVDHLGTSEKWKNLTDLKFSLLTSIIIFYFSMFDIIILQKKWV